MSRRPDELAESIAPSQHETAVAKRAEVRNWLIVIGFLIASGTGAAGYLDLFRDKSQPTPAGSTATAPGAISVTVNGNVTGTSLLNGVQTTGHDARDVSASATPTITSASVPPPTVPARTQSQISRYERYIDRNVHRVAGKLNVAVAFQGASTSVATALQEAMRRALIDHDMTLTPLFRDAFMHEGLAHRMFNGDASLARDLKLREYVDSVLVAELRFTGPAQMSDNGMYIREAVLEVHAIDPASGEIRQILEIRDKGGGPNEEQSSNNAIDRLEQQVEASIGEWKWV